MKNLTKLVLFDIDGTLIHHVGAPQKSAYRRFEYAIKKAFGIDVVMPSQNYNGWVDRQIVWFIVQPYGVAKEDFIEKFPKVSRALHAFSLEQGKSEQPLYTPVMDAVQLAILLQKKEDIRLGILTGNVERMAWWKLEHARINNIFSFGLFGDDVDDRITLAKTVFEKAKKHFNITFSPQDIVVIGDAIGDIKCGKAIGATTIITMTGNHSSREVLQTENPDFLVDSLMDKPVRGFFGV